MSRLNFSRRKQNRQTWVQSQEGHHNRGGSFNVFASFRQKIEATIWSRFSRRLRTPKRSRKLLCAAEPLEARLLLTGSVEVEQSTNLDYAYEGLSWLYTGPNTHPTTGVDMYLNDSSAVLTHDSFLDDFNLGGVKESGPDQQLPQSHNSQLTFSGQGGGIQGQYTTYDEYFVGLDADTGIYIDPLLSGNSATNVSSSFLERTRTQFDIGFSELSFNVDVSAAAARGRVNLETAPAPPYNISAWRLPIYSGIDIDGNPSWDWTVFPEAPFYVYRDVPPAGATIFPYERVTFTGPPDGPGESYTDIGEAYAQAVEAGYYAHEATATASGTYSNVAWLAGTDLREGMWVKGAFGYNMQSGTSIDPRYSQQPMDYGTSRYQLEIQYLNDQQQLLQDIYIDDSTPLGVNTDEKTGSYDIPIMAGANVNVTVEAEASMGELRGHQYAWHEASTSGAYLQSQGRITGYDIRVLAGRVNKRTDTIDIAFASDLAPLDALSSPYFYNSLYWFSSDQDTLTTQAEFEAAYASRTYAVTPGQFPYSSIQEISLTNLEAMGVDISNKGPGKTYSVSIPLASLQSTTLENPRLAVHLDSGPIVPSHDFFDGDAYEDVALRYDNFFEIRPDVELEEVHWNAEGGVYGQYAIHWVRPLDEAVEIDLYWSADTTWDAGDLKGTPNPILSRLESGVDIPFVVTKDQLDDARLTDHHLISFIDSPPDENGELFEGDLYEKNNTDALEVPDLKVISLEYLDRTSVWHVSQGLGPDDYVGFTYDIIDADLINGDRTAEVRFYWSDGSGQQTPQMIYSESSRKEVGQHNIIVKKDYLANVPTWAKEILVIIDEDNDIREYDESNNRLTLDLGDLIIDHLRWGTEAEKGGVVGKVRVTGTLLEPTKIEFYWHSNGNLSPIQIALLTSVEEAAGAIDLAVGLHNEEIDLDLERDGKVYRAPRPDEKYLYVVVDKDMVVPESNESNNQQVLQFDLLSPTYEVRTDPDPVLRKDPHNVYVVLWSDNPVPISGYGFQWQETDDTAAEKPVTIRSGPKNGAKEDLLINPFEEKLELLGSYDRNWEWIPPYSDSLLQSVINLNIDAAAYVDQGFKKFWGSISGLISGLQASLDAKFDNTDYVKIIPTAKYQSLSVPQAFVGEIEMKVAPRHQAGLLASIFADQMGGKLFLGGFETLAATAGAGWKVAAIQFVAAAGMYVSSYAAYQYAYDPPDPNYTETVLPPDIELIVGNAELNGDEERLLYAQSRYTSLKQAEGRARDKADGAVLANDMEWAAIQTSAAANFASQALEAGLQLQAMRDKLGLNQETEFSPSELQQYVQDNGLPEAFVNALQDAGMSADFINGLASRFTSVDASAEDTTLSDTGTLHKGMLFDTAVAAIEDVQLAAKYRLLTEQGELSEVDEQTLLHFETVKTSIETQITEGVSAESLYAQLLTLRDELVEVVQNTNNFEAVSDYFTFCYETLLDVGFRLPPIVSLVTVEQDGGQPNTASSLQLDFDSEVLIDTGAFELKSADETLVTLVPVISLVDGKTQVVLTFDGELTDANGALLDGSYTLKILSANVLNAGGSELDGDGDLSAGGDFIYQFYVNSVPALDAISDAVVAIDAGEQTVALTGISAGGGAVQQLRITATSSASTLIPDPLVEYNSPDATGNLKFTPVSGQSGSATITVTVVDAGLDGVFDNADDASFTRTFNITVSGLEMVSLRMVTSPTAADTNGEVQSLPTGQNWIAEWDSYWIELWVTTADLNSQGIASVSLDLAYLTGLTSATSIEFGAAFTQNQAGTIHDGNGLVEGLAASTNLTDLGINTQLLFARIRFESLAGDEVLLDLEGKRIGPHDLGFQIQTLQIGLGSERLNQNANVDHSAAAIWANPYDLNDDGQVGFRDLLLFASVYNSVVVGASSDYAWFSDFNRNGRVAFRDLVLLATNYNKSKLLQQEVIYPNNYPQDWDQQLQVSSLLDAPSTATELTRDQAQTALQSAVDDVRPNLTDEGQQKLSQVQVEVVDLSGNTLGRVEGNTIYLDVNAAGYGWFVDQTPWDHSEFYSDGQLSLIALPDSEAAGLIDLWTVIRHELGHLLGYEHTDDGLMEAVLDPGERKPADWSEEADDFFASLEDDTELLSF